ncbi:hypothetical protein [Nonomuraea polychroma]|uniref:hypothetical protein n=1 Tax=Nonomuraea polychroma TaxID=46176 RepID=UPI000FDF25CE|nr:hypothetical protein [Nonomuraea polychroma]
MEGKFVHDARLRDESMSLGEIGAQRLVLDLGGVSAWDDAGVGAVIAATKRVISFGGCLPIAEAADLFERFHRQGLVAPRFELRESVMQAVNEFGRSSWSK